MSSMKPSSVHLSRPVDSATLALLDGVTAAAAGLDVPILLIGAFARDVIFEHVHGVLTERATGDVDVAVLAKTWQQYAELQTALLGMGFARHPNQAQRLVHCTGLVTDVIPCGDVAAADGHIRWPEDGALMSVVGFDDAFRHAVRVQLRDAGALPGLIVNVASPAAVAILKLIAWNDRQQERRRDMADLAFMVQHYLDAGNRERLLGGEHADLLAREPFDSDLVGAELLGRDMSAMASPRTREDITAILKRETAPGGQRQMLQELRKAWAGDFRRAQAVASSLCNGFSAPASSGSE